MLELHLPTCDFIVPFYDRLTRYSDITFSLAKQHLIDYDDALYKIRLELYGLHNQIYKLVLPLKRRMTRYNSQINASRQVCSFENS